MVEIEFEIGAASRPCPGFIDNGDRYYVNKTESGLMVAVIDGLGHGSPASEAAEIALECLQQRGNDTPENFYRICEEKLVKTRGVVAGIATIDTRTDKLEYVGIGNIEAQVYSGGNVYTLISRHGVVGYGQRPKTRAHDTVFAPGAMLIMFSDGISTKFKLSEYYGLVDQPAQFIADVLIRDWSRTTDDATVVVVRRRKIDELS